MSNNEVINELTRLKDKMNALPWKFEIQFPATSSIPNVDPRTLMWTLLFLDMDTSGSNVDSPEIPL